MIIRVEDHWGKFASVHIRGPRYRGAPFGWKRRLSLFSQAARVIVLVLLAMAHTAEQGLHRVFIQATERNIARESGAGMCWAPQSTAEIRCRMRWPLNSWRESTCDFGVEYLEAQGLAGQFPFRRMGITDGDKHKTNRVQRRIKEIKAVCVFLYRSS